MAKKAGSAHWGCTECGATTSGWFGRCPACGAWNTVEEIHEPAMAEDRVTLQLAGPAAPVAATRASSVETRTPTGIGEIDRVLGGGLVAGSVVLLGGPPGVGKSTLLLQASATLSRNTGPVLYASGEESVAQVASRAARLGVSHDNLWLLAETRIEAIVEAARARPDLAALVVDSVQTVYTATQGLPGNITQIRAVASQLVSYSKTLAVPVVLVGHVTKDGQLAGPRVLEHLVDAVLWFEGEEGRPTRLLRATKNRFGSTHELGVFEMNSDGLREISNPSELFFARRETAVVGACVTPTLEGSRPLLIEVQALLADNHGGGPRRNCVGVEASRVAMLLAVLDRHGGAFVLDRDVFVNVVGGMRLSEPAADLPVVLAVASSHTGKALPSTMVAFGEIGLTGELRPVAGAEARLMEAHRQGFRRAIVPAGNETIRAPIEIVPAANVQEALERAF